jgi:hypothetical protein
MIPCRHRITSAIGFVFINRFSQESPRSSTYLFRADRRIDTLSREKFAIIPTTVASPVAKVLAHQTNRRGKPNKTAGMIQTADWRQ